MLTLFLTLTLDGRAGSESLRLREEGVRGFLRGIPNPLQMPSDNAKKILLSP